MYHWTYPWLMFRLRGSGGSSSPARPLIFTQVYHQPNIMQIYLISPELFAFKVLNRNAAAVPIIVARRPKLTQLLSLPTSFLPLKIMTVACSEHEIQKPEVPLQYQGQPLESPKSNRFLVWWQPTHTPNIITIHRCLLELCCTQTDTDKHTRTKRKTLPPWRT